MDTDQGKASESKLFDTELSAYVFHDLLSG